LFTPITRHAFFTICCHAADFRHMPYQELSLLIVSIDYYCYFAATRYWRY